MFRIQPSVHDKSGQRFPSEGKDPEGDVWGPADTSWSGYKLDRGIRFVNVYHTVHFNMHTSRICYVAMDI